jgi:ArsR family transcriptional regulator
MTPNRLEDPTVRAEPPAASDVELARLAKAVGHPARVAILRHLAQSGACVCGDLVLRLPLAQSTVSQHLKILKSAGLLQGMIDGPRVCYCVSPDAVHRLRELVGELCSSTRAGCCPAERKEGP